ncbi:uncharacterized protein LOC123517366 [Portunus trituberculatus]|uniref:uncharacterized protein LOC123517366 n=1 Tax=Portunus trituberculatus TaxID=210409 RepID=UPI001E1CB7C3|nr:uncharacterized protein LOC123517366 [Portunus trituberculatus]
MRGLQSQSRPASDGPGRGKNIETCSTPCTSRHRGLNAGASFTLPRQMDARLQNVASNQATPHTPPHACTRRTQGTSRAGPDGVGHVVASPLLVGTSLLRVYTSQRLPPLLIVRQRATSLHLKKTLRLYVLHGCLFGAGFCEGYSARQDNMVRNDGILPSPLRSRHHLFHLHSPDEDCLGQPPKCDFLLGQCLHLL